MVSTRAKKLPQKAVNSILLLYIYTKAISKKESKSPLQIRNRIHRASRRRRVAMIIIIVTVLTAMIYTIYQRPDIVFDTPHPRLSQTQGDLAKGTPNFSTVLPEGRTIEEYGGWTRVSPPERNPVFAYVDEIDGTPIRVSQQPLPEQFRNDTDEQVQLLAQGYSANTVIDADKTTVYIGTSAKGPQSVIFTKNDLLVLIKANAKLPNKAWVRYVRSLE